MKDNTASSSSSYSRQATTSSTPSTPQTQRQAYHSGTSNRPLSPDSEHRQRKSLLQKQRKYLNNGGSSSTSLSSHNGGHTNNNNSNRIISALELESLITGGGDDLSSTSHNNNRIKRCRGIRYPNSPSLRRFGSIMGMAAVFCILVLVREQHVQDENSIFQRGNSQTKSQKQKSSGPMQALADMITPAPTPAPTPTSQAASSSNAATASTTIPPTANPKNTANLGLGDFSDSTAGDADVDDDDPIDGLKSDASNTESANANANTNAHQLDWQTLEEQQQQKIVQQLSSQQKEPHKQQSATKHHPNMPLRYPLLPLDTSNNHSFVHKHCDLQGTDWFPFDKELSKNVTLTSSSSSSSPQHLIPSWHQRAPFVMLLGPPHGGSDVVYQLLSTHPQIADAMESQFFTFNHKQFVVQSSSSSPKSSSSSSPKYNNNSTGTTRIRTRAARQAYMARHIAIKRQLQDYPSEVVLDSVPDTLLYSKRMAPFVLCVMPWVKLVITVSHPVKRLLKHYQQATQKGLTLTLEEWISRDLDRMQEAGLLVKQPQQQQSNSSTTTTTTGTQTKLVPGTNHDAWNAYQKLTPTAMDASAGQSLYEFMVHPWYTWMEQMGRNPQTEILLVQRELLVQHSHDSNNKNSNNNNNPHETLVQEYQRIVQRLGLAPHTPPEATVQQVLARQEKHDWIEEIDKDLRRDLRRFFKPYNDRFDQFLQSYYHTDGLTATNNSLLHWNPALWKVS